MLPWRWRWTIMLASFFGLINASAKESFKTAPLVKSNVGQIRGLRATDGDYSMFMGIPYATVNTSNPFGASIPHPGFEEVFEAYEDSGICPQVEEFNNTVVGTLDCLHLNIYVPNTASDTNRLPVLVYIYGGAFKFGFAGRYVYGPRYLVQHNIILITINYRVGPYGFMCLNIPSVPGNQGLKDQRLALKWIKDNIEAFGGDSCNITISGNSAGSLCADYHLIYSKEKIFNQVILQSGTALYPEPVITDSVDMPLVLCKHLGFVTNSTQEALQYLSAIDSNVLITAAESLNLTYSPCVEKYFHNVEIFMWDYPVNVINYNKLKFDNMSILLGYNSDEAHITVTNYSELFSNNIGKYFYFDTKQQIEFEQHVQHFYIGDEKPSYKVKKQIIRGNSDFFSIYPVVRTMQMYLNSNVKNIYNYIFSYSGKRNFVKSRVNDTSKGAAHADEIGYLFEVSYMDKPTQEDQRIIDYMTTLWANFVKFGNPIPKLTQLLTVKWPPVTKSVQYALQIDSQLKLKKRNYTDRMTFWDLMYEVYGEIQVGYRPKNMKISTCEARYEQNTLTKHVHF